MKGAVKESIAQYNTYTYIHTDTHIRSSTLNIPQQFPDIL